MNIEHGGKFVLSNGILTERVHVEKNVGNHCVSSEDHIVVSLSVKSQLFS